MKGNIELLAPAGNMECFIAAINAGADAVYIGGDKFSARAYAGNFNINSIREAVDYAHLRGVKVYVTLNTLIKENEFQEAKAYIDDLYIIGVDALIIQDPGVANYITQVYPDFEIHASTQMTVHNGEAAKYLVDKGFKRIVLSRELTLKEIGYISKDLNIETEMFVHGALCVSYSGQCLMSSLIGGRSGNRGRCAQACRMPYTLINKDTLESKEGYLLSPKDMCTIDLVEDIINSGTKSLKIEGRMKRAEYVAGVVNNYRKIIDSILEGNSEKTNVEGSKEELLQLFNREGFNKAYLKGNPGIELMAVNNPKNAGVYLGRVNKDLTISLHSSIDLKDGLSNGENGFVVTKITQGNTVVSTAEKGERVKLYPQSYKKGDTLYRTSSERVNNKYKVYGDINLSRKKPINLSLTFEVDKPFTLSCKYKDKIYHHSCGVVQKAINKPTTLEKLKENISKTGNSPFYIENINAKEYELGFLPISEINKARRELLENIEKDIVEGYRRKSKLNSTYENNLVKAELLPEYILTINTKEQWKAFLQSDLKAAAVNLFWRKNGLREEDLKGVSHKEIYLKIPNIIREEFNSVVKLIERNINNIKGLITANLGIINEFKNKTSIIGDYKLNLFNSYSGDFYYEDLKACAVSIELNKKEINEVSNKSKIPLQAIIYGKIEMMVMEYCPIGSVAGGKCMGRGCQNICEKGNYVLKDRLNKEFSVHTDLFCRSYILNTVPINLIDKRKEFIDMGINSFRIDLTHEDYNESLRIIHSLKEKDNQINDQEFTRGHYKRGVE